MGRVTNFASGIAYTVLALLSGVVLLGGGYWLSDRVYDAGLWPLGAMMRILLLLMLVGYVVGIPMMLFAALSQLFARDGAGESLSARSTNLAQPPLRLSPNQVDEILAHSNRELPNMARGIIGGVNGTASVVYEAQNEEKSPFRYSIDPNELALIYRSLDDNGLEMVAVYSSKPHGEAHPSVTDVRMAYTDVFYVYISLQAKQPAIRAFRIAEEHVEEHTVEIV